jgi:hypothetical protein
LSDLQYGNEEYEPLLNGAKLVSDLTVFKIFHPSEYDAERVSAITQPWDMPSNIPKQIAKRTVQFM